MEFVGYETRDKLIRTSGKGCRNTNIISKQGIPKSNMNMKYPSATLCFCYSPHKEICDISSENLVSNRLQEYTSIYEGDVLRHINKVKSIHGIGPPTTCGHQHCGEKHI